jgi:hypothetical protein
MRNDESTLLAGSRQVRLPAMLAHPSLDRRRFFSHRRFLTSALLAATCLGSAAAPMQCLWRVGQPDTNTAEFALAPADYGQFEHDGFFVVGVRPKTDLALRASGTGGHLGRLIAPHLPGCLRPEDHSAARRGPPRGRLCPYALPEAAAPDGAGPALARSAVNVAGADPANWRASAQLGGTPGAENFPVIPPTLVTNTLVAMDGLWKFNNAGADLGTAWRDARTTPPPQYNNNLQLNVASPNNQDMVWLAERTCSLNQ